MPNVRVSVFFIRPVRILFWWLVCFDSVVAYEFMGVLVGGEMIGAVNDRGKER